METLNGDSRSFLFRWLPHTLRRQFLLAVAVLTSLILAGGGTALYALRSSAKMTHLLAEERLTQMQQAQDLVQRTLQIEQESYRLTEAESLDEIRANYGEIVQQTTEFDAAVDRLANNEDLALLELHQASQLFRTTSNVVAQVLERDLREAGGGRKTSSETAKRYLRELHEQSGALVSATRLQSERFSELYRDAVRNLETTSRRNARWVTLLLAGSLLAAWVVSRWFLGQHVLGRLQQLSRNLRLGNNGESAAVLEVAPIQDGLLHDEIDEMSHAVDLFQEDRRRLGLRTAELLLARDAAEAANKAKSVFLANMSHELRTPLNAILGFSSLMRSATELPESQRENLDIINRSGEHLLKLINDVLEMAKIEAGRLQLEVVVFDLWALVQEVADSMGLRASEKGLRLLLDRAPEVPRYIKGDEARVRQILLNLVSNAVKFTVEGGVTIRLGTRENARHHLLLEVEDTGPGITPQDQTRLFQPFVQLAPAPFSRGAEGTGLGLAITQEFVQLMGGTITLSSELDRGSIFRVDLPLEVAREKDAHSLEQREHGNVIGLAPGQRTYRVLVTDDQPENQMLLTRLMENIGMETRTANDGEECERIFKEWAPDLIWMDRRMPVMDGLEATRRIRRLPNGDKVKIVAVTASAFKEQFQEMRDAGMDDFVRKPYRFDDLYDCMTRQLGVKFLYDDEPTTPGVADGASVKIELAPRLAMLSIDLRQALKQALETLETDRVASAIHRVSDVDAELGQALTQLARGFDYPAILAALDESLGPRG